MTHSDCHEKGHTPGWLSRSAPRSECSKCGQPIFSVHFDNGGVAHNIVWRTQAELDRLWKGALDRQAASDVGGRHGG